MTGFSGDAAATGRWNWELWRYSAADWEVEASGWELCEFDDDMEARTETTAASKE